MDTHDFLLIRIAMIATLFGLWLAGAAVVGFLQRRRRPAPTSPKAMPVDGLHATAANAASGANNLGKAA